jgi:hypothetical protein
MKALYVEWCVDVGFLLCDSLPCDLCELFFGGEEMEYESDRERCGDGLEAVITQFVCVCISFSSLSLSFSPFSTTFSVHMRTHS